MKSPTRVMKDVKFAKIGSVSSILGLLVALAQPLTKSKTIYKLLDKVYELLGTERQKMQYSIHMGPGAPHETADDITSDQSHNLEAVALGKAAYKYYSFHAFLVQSAKSIFKYLDQMGSGFKLLHRACDTFDSIIMGRITSLYWNIRRVSMAMIPFTEKKHTSSQVQTNHEKIQRAFSSFLNLSLKKIHKNPLLSIIFNNFKHLGWDKQTVNNKLLQEGNERLLDLTDFAYKSWKNNLMTLFTGKYESEGTVHKIGEHDPTTLPIYKRSKILSQVLGFPMGLAATFLNVFSMGIGVFGRMLGNAYNLDNLGIKLSNIANALQTTMYATSEIPGHLHNFIKSYKRTGKFGWGSETGIDNLKSLGIFSSGAIAAIMTFIKPFYSNPFFNKIQLQLFRLFFSGNRWKVHSDEYKEKLKTALDSDIQEAEKVAKKNPLEILLRVLFRDPFFAYESKESIPT